jgi:hypothetical protein
MQSNNFITIPNIIFLLFWIAAFITWCYGAYFSFKIRKKFNPEKKWGKYLPYSIFMSRYFTEEGNIYRIKILRSMAIFLVLWGCGFAIALIFFK